jgi:deoxyuridine 5'-triphosphate nucleotidohydrolase
MERHIFNNHGELRVVTVGDSSEKPELASSVKPLDTRWIKTTYKGANALDYLLSDNSRPLDTIEEMYMSTKGTLLPFKYTLTDDLGIPPQRARPSDSGFDLTLIGVRKQFGKVTMYGTGVSVQPPSGYYFDLVPRSSMIKTGYMLANSVGIIDQAYTGEIMVPLIKIDPDAPDLELPAKLVQLIPRRWFGFYPVNTELDETSRADGGFGSTNNK